MQTQTNSRSHTDGIMAAALQGEVAKPANCFSIDHRGIREGLELELAHPLTGKSPALFLDASYVRVETQHPCIIDRMGTTGIVRRAEIDWKERPNFRSLPTLVQPNQGNPAPLLYSNTRIELGKGAKFNERFYAGTEAMGEIVAWSGDRKEMLVQFSENDDAVIYFPDGSVRFVMWQGGSDTDSCLTEVKLTFDEQAGHRLRRIDNELSSIKAKPLEGSDRIRIEDSLYHELIAILNIGGTRLTSAFETIYDRLETLKAKGVLRAGVDRHALEVLKKHWPTHALCFRDAVLIQSGPNFTPSTHFPVQARKGPPAAALKRKSDRSERDRQERLARRGASSGGKQQTKSKKK